MKFKSIVCVLPLCLGIFPNISFSQNTEVDSVIHLIQTDKEDTNKVNHLNTLAILLWDNLDTAIICSSKALEVAKSIKLSATETGWPFGIARSQYQLGVFNFDKGNFEADIDYNVKALKIWNKLELETKPPHLFRIKISKAQSLNEIGIAFENQGNFAKALDYDLQALKINEEFKLEKGIGNVLGNIGNIYINQKNYPKALEYYNKSYATGKKLGNKLDMSIDLRNIGNVYKNLGKPEKALGYILQALELSKQLNNEANIAFNQSGVGNLLKDIADTARANGKPYSELKADYERAQFYLEQSLKMDQKLGIQNNEAENYAVIGSIYYLQKNYKQAEVYLLKAYAIDTAIGATTQIKSAAEDLSYIYEELGDYKKSLAFFKISSFAKDSIFNEEKDKEITKHQMNYEFEKKENALKAEQNKKEAIADADKKRQNIFFWLMCIVALAIAIIAIIVFRSLRITNKQKNIIEYQKEIVEEKQREILDSIHYAKRIQQSLLPNEKYIHKNLQRLNKKS